MSPSRDLLVTVVAIVVLVAAMGVVWGIDQQKDAERLTEQQAALGQDYYQTPVHPQQYRIVIVKAPDRDAPPTELPNPPAGASAGNSDSNTTPADATTARRSPTPQPDFDGDGISDASDRCPTRPETANGFQDGDGCPDVVQTTTGAS